jgi:serpin B
MWISRVSHLTYLKCHEAGTEVAGEISCEQTDGFSLEEPKVFRADRPFWFMLLDQAQGTVLYSGFVESVEEAGDSVEESD